LDTLKRLKKDDFWVECTTLIVPDDNDSEEELRDIASFIVNELDSFTPWHISAFHPDYKVQNKNPTSVKSLIKAYEIGRESGLEYIYMGNIPTNSTTHCPNCHKNLIERKGYKLLSHSLKDGKCPDCQRVIEGVW